MYLGQRTRNTIRVASIAVAIYVAVAATLAWAFPGAGSFASSFVRWFLGIPVGLTIYGVLEWGGGKLLSLALWERMPSVVRVLFLVLLVALIVVAVIAIKGWWHAQSAL